MLDKIEKIGNSTIQHGPLNQRIYLMKVDANDIPQIIEQLADLAQISGYTKIFAKVPASLVHPFTNAGYVREAAVPFMQRRMEDVVFLGRFLSTERRKADDLDEIQQILQAAAKKANGISRELPDGFSLREATANDVVQMSEVYKNVFETYPFPIHDPSYLAETMDSHVDYFCVCRNEEIVSVASAEKDKENACCEMTDFATLPEYRGSGLATILLKHMDKEVLTRGIATGFTIARARSAGMNITFARCGYTFGGTLVNNTCISGQIESMNVWHKSLVGV